MKLLDNSNYYKYFIFKDKWRLAMKEIALNNWNL